ISIARASAADSAAAAVVAALPRRSRPRTRPNIRWARTPLVAPWFSIGSRARIRTSSYPSSTRRGSSFAPTRASSIRWRMRPRSVSYATRVTVNGKTIATESFKLIPDPRSKGVAAADYAEQFALLTKIRDRFSETNDAVKTIRFVKRELEDRRKRLAADRQASFGTVATALEQALSQVEDSLYQTKNRSGQDPLNYPIRLNNKIGALMGVVGSADGRPTQQSYAVFTELSQELDRELAVLRRTLDAGLPRVNSMLR